MRNNNLYCSVIGSSLLLLEWNIKEVTMRNVFSNYELRAVAEQIVMLQWKRVCRYVLPINMVRRSYAPIGVSNIQI